MSLANGTIGGASLPAMVWGTVREGIRQRLSRRHGRARTRTVMSVTDAEPLMEPVGEPLPPPAAPAARVLEPGDLVASWRIAIVRDLGARRVRVHHGVEDERRTRHRHLVARGAVRPAAGGGPRLIPFAVAIGFGLVSSFDLKRLPVVTVLGAVVLTLIAPVPDYSRSSGLANVEMVIAGRGAAGGPRSIHRCRENRRPLASTAMPPAPSSDEQPPHATSNTSKRVLMSLPVGERVGIAFSGGLDTGGRRVATRAKGDPLQLHRRPRPVRRARTRHGARPRQEYGAEQARLIDCREELVREG